MASNPLSSAIAADTRARTSSPGYTGAELDAQFATLTPEQQQIVQSYVDGINRYITDVVAPDQQNKLPFEFHELGIGVPEAWTARDVVAVNILLARFGNVGGTERANQTLLDALIKKYGPAAGYAVFNDLRWVNDPDTPVSVPVEGAIDRRQKAHGLPPGLAAQLEGAGHAPLVDDDAADAFFRAVGVPTGLGSHGWVVSPARSANGFAMLFGGPQVEYNAPEILHEVQLKGGNGFNVVGVALAGVPLIAIGRNDHLAWTITTGAGGDNVDIYKETLCGGGTGYLFDGACRPFETRTEVIAVRGATPVRLEVRRTIHGPVVATTPGFAFTQKRVTWGQDIALLTEHLGFSRARNLNTFEAAVHDAVQSFNILYADKVGNIAYWLAGMVPVRPDGFDTRLPLPGDGSAEWTGNYVPIPKSINPARGWLANWNNKPSADYAEIADQRTFGKMDRVMEIEHRLAMDGPFTFEDMKSIAEDIARTNVGGVGRNSRLLKPYLFAALDAVRPSHPLASQARAVVEAWEGNRFADARTSTTLERGQVVFSGWFNLMVTNTFRDELEANVGAANANTLVHVLDDALGGGSGVPPSRDYFNGIDPNVKISSTFDEALAALGPDPSVWSTRPGPPTVTLRHPLFPRVPDAGTIPDVNRGTYAQIVILGRPKITSVNIFPLGQSGFIQRTPAGDAQFDPHFADQLELYRDFLYKPMRLYLNTQLKQ